MKTIIFLSFLRSVVWRIMMVLPPLWGYHLGSKTPKKQFRPKRTWGEGRNGQISIFYPIIVKTRVFHSKTQKPNFWVRVPPYSGLKMPLFERQEKGQKWLSAKNHELKTRSFLWGPVTIWLYHYEGIQLLMTFKVTCMENFYHFSIIFTRFHVQRPLFYSFFFTF